MDTLKLHVEVGNNKFDGEGPAELVKELYQAFLGKIGQQPAAAPAAAILSANNQKGGEPLNVTELDPVMKRLFVERDGMISLQARPQTDDADGDSLVLLIYGYQALKP